MHILLRVMLRRLLTFLALLTGLTALAAPANASVVEALSCEVSVSAHQGDTGTEQHEDCPGEEAKRGPKNPQKGTTPQRKRRTVRPPVLFGVDRAHE